MFSKKLKLNSVVTIPQFIETVFLINKTQSILIVIK
jgi:hypothetical protein